MEREIKKMYGNQMRVRTCGLCWQDEKLLMVNHRGVTSGDFWAPPGGGVEFGEPVEIRLQKEFLEETGLLVKIGAFRFACEFIQKPLHAVELFFEVTVTGGALQKGDDPEMAIIEEVRFMSASEIAKIPADSLHGVFRVIRSAEDLQKLSGFFTL